MDALSSQATIAGYKAVLLAADHLKKLCPLLMTAAGTIPPARVVVFGAGVAGLQAIATARRLGCVVEVSDVRHAVKEQVESLGARFLSTGGRDQEGKGGYAVASDEHTLSAQREVLRKHVAEADIVITTALVPLSRAPILVDEAMVRSMRPNSVLVDLAVESGGNCALTERGAIVERHGVTLIGLENLPALVPTHASELYARNVLALVRTLLGKQGELLTAFEDEVHAGCLLTHRGEIVHAGARGLFPAAEAVS
jgi:NAD(P) transhydrogenase subunit alpha